MINHRVRLVPVYIMHDCNCLHCVQLQLSHLFDATVICWHSSYFLGFILAGLAYREGTSDLHRLNALLRHHLETRSLCHHLERRS